jgi:small subunit ribosomal protein S1
MSRPVPEVPPQAWQEFIAAHSDGGVLHGQVVSVVPFGAFVECAEGIHGLLHKSEWATEPQPGTTIAVRIVSVDLANRRFSLTLA